jgi:hypothetical protein
MCLILRQSGNATAQPFGAFMVGKMKFDFGALQTPIFWPRKTLQLPFDDGGRPVIAWMWQILLS